MIFPLLTLLLASAVAASAAPHSTARPRIVVLGDSLASGRGIGGDRAFPGGRKEKLDDAGLAFEMVTAGVWGDTTAGGVRRYEKALDGDVRVLVLELGANDGLRGVPVAQVKEN